jgi:hypothetical protein
VSVNRSVCGDVIGRALSGNYSYCWSRTLGKSVCGSCGLFGAEESSRFRGSTAELQQSATRDLSLFCVQNPTEAAALQAMRRLEWTGITQTFMKERCKFVDESFSRRSRFRLMGFQFRRVTPILLAVLQSPPGKPLPLSAPRFFRAGGACGARTGPGGFPALKSCP